VARIVWVVSYPKSGNTWLRALLTNYRREGDRAAGINELEGVWAISRLWFDQWTGVEASALPDHVVERLRPAVYRCWSREATETLYVPVHEAWRRTDRGEPLFPAEISGGVIYVGRNPLDVVPSWAAYFGVEVAEAVDQVCDPEHVPPVALGLPMLLRQVVGDWSGHVRSWLDDSGLPLHMVRYEDLVADPENVFAGVIRFCGLPIDQEQVARAIRFSDFTELQRQEREAGFYELPPKASAPFFRRGRPGGWREELSPDLVERLIDVHRDTMRRLGYLDDADRPTS
jgi:aryl sulfotransferase